MYFILLNKFYLQLLHLMDQQEQPSLDELDFKILACLQKDGRMSLTVMAASLKVSIGTVRTRLNKLLDDGTVNIIGRVDPEKVGFNCYAHIAVYIRPATFKEKVAQKISKLPEVSFLAMTSGDYDLEVDVMCRDITTL